MAYQAESSKVVEIPPNFYIGHLIGRKGKTIRDIQKLTGAKIIIPRKREETSSLPQKWFSFKVWPWSGFRKLDGAVVGRPGLHLKPKLYTPSTLNIDFIQWHTQLNVCAVK